MDLTVYVPLNGAENFKYWINPDSTDISNDQGPCEVDKAEGGGCSHANPLARINVVQQTKLQNLYEFVFLFLSPDMICFQNQYLPFN
jgi:hypothetical protein